MNRLRPEIVITDRPLVIPPIQFAADAGAIVEFQGVVRGKENSNSITGIYYEAFLEMAYHQLGILAAEAFTQFSICELTLHHRIGLVPVAEPSLFLRVCAAHRRPAFEAAEWSIVQLKLRVPIWKHPKDQFQVAARFEKTGITS